MSGFLGMFVGGTGVPSAPTIGTATAGNGQATITFTAPSSDGGSPILDYQVTSSPGGVTATGSGSPITITGLSNGTAYTFTVRARNANGYSISSTSSNQVTPVVPPITASGGNYIYDGTGSFAGYRFHVFTSPGTFRVTSNDGNLGFASVIVGGGGGVGFNGTSSNGTAGGGGGGVTDVTGIPLTPNTDYSITVGSGGTRPTLPQAASPGQTSSWAGGSAGGGGATQGGNPAGNGTSASGYPSGGGIPGWPSGFGPRSGPGGGGNGGAGGDVRQWTRNPPPSLPGYSPVYDANGYPTPYLAYFGTGGYAGGGGLGSISSIDGKKYGGGGGGGAVGNPIYSNGLYTPEADPNGSIFTSYGGGVGETPGTSGTGGGGGGRNSGSTSSINGGPGTVVIRYPYP